MIKEIPAGTLKVGDVIKATSSGYYLGANKGTYTLRIGDKIYTREYVITNTI